MKYTLAKGRILIEETGCVDDIHFDYCVTDVREQKIVSGFNDMDDWCREIVGISFIHWKRRYSNYWFTNQDDALLFLLKWS